MGRQKEGSSRKRTGEKNEESVSSGGFLTKEDCGIKDALKSLYVSKVSRPRQGLAF